MTRDDLIKYFNYKINVPAEIKVLYIFFPVAVLILLEVLNVSADGSLIIGMFVPIFIFSIAFILYDSTRKSYERTANIAVDDYCESLASDYIELKKLVVNAFGIQIDDVMSTSDYCFENIFKYRLSRNCNDGKIRTSIYETTCIFFAGDNIYYYNNRSSLISNEKVEKQKGFKRDEIIMVSLEEYANYTVIVIVIPSNEKIIIKCKSRESAVEIANKRFAKNNHVYL